MKYIKYLLLITSNIINCGKTILLDKEKTTLINTHIKTEFDKLLGDNPLKILDKDIRQYIKNTLLNHFSNEEKLVRKIVSNGYNNYYRRNKYKKNKEYKEKNLTRSKKYYIKHKFKIEKNKEYKEHFLTMRRKIYQKRKNDKEYKEHILEMRRKNYQKRKNDKEYKEKMSTKSKKYYIKIKSDKKKLERKKIIQKQQYEKIKNNKQMKDRKNKNERERYYKKKQLGKITMIEFIHEFNLGNINKSNINEIFNLLMNKYVESKKQIILTTLIKIANDNVNQNINHNKNNKKKLINLKKEKRIIENFKKTINKLDNKQIKFSYKEENFLKEKFFQYYKKFYKKVKEKKIKKEIFEDCSNLDIENIDNKAFYKNYYNDSQIEGNNIYDYNSNESIYEESN